MEAEPSPTFEEDYLDIDHWPHAWRVESDGGPIVYPPLTEADQRAFDSTCRLLYRFTTLR